MTDQFPNGLCSSCFEPCSGGTKCPNCGWDPGNPGFQSSQALQNGSILNGAYIIGKVLGQGGFGITYLAWDISSGRKVAIKECFPGTPRVERLANGFDLVTSGQSPEEKGEFERAVSKFIQEASTLAQFYGEPTIVEVLGLFRANKTAYMIMEYLDGHTLGEEIRKNKKLSPERVMEVALSVSKALSVIHGQGVLHRDISPDNIYITRDGSIKVLDFGTARDISGNRTMTVNLKHGYAPLEQYLGKNQGPWTDIYSLGATMFRALTGKMPPRADERKMGDDSLLLGILDQELSGRMKLVVRKALAVEIDERYQNIFDFVEVLSNGEATLPGQEEEDLFYQRTVKYSGLFPSDLQRERGSPTQDIVPEIRQEETATPGEPDSKKETEPALEKVLLQSPPDLQVDGGIDVDGFDDLFGWVSVIQDEILLKEKEDKIKREVESRIRELESEKRRIEGQEREARRQKEEQEREKEEQEREKERKKFEKERPLKEKIADLVDYVFGNSYFGKYTQFRRMFFRFISWPFSIPFNLIDEFDDSFVGAIAKAIIGWLIPLAIPSLFIIAGYSRGSLIDLDIGPKIFLIVLHLDYAIATAVYGYRKIYIVFALPTCLFCFLIWPFYPFVALGILIFYPLFLMGKWEFVLGVILWAIIYYSG